MEENKNENLPSREINSNSNINCIENENGCGDGKINALVLQTDFGLGDGAVCAMYGVARSVEP